MGNSVSTSDPTPPIANGSHGMPRPNQIAKAHANAQKAKNTTSSTGGGRRTSKNNQKSVRKTKRSHRK